MLAHLISISLALWSIGPKDGMIPPEKPLDNVVSITFDDGPHMKYTSAVLDILQEKSVPATFFVIGSRIAKNGDVLRRELREGHQIGNHSYLHPMFTRLSLLEITREVLRTDLDVFLATATLPRYFRFPYGVEDSRIGYITGRPIIGWSVDAYDWKAKNPKILANNIIRQAKSGSIILLHDIKADTVAALPDIIDGIRAKGYRIVPLTDLLSLSNKSDTRAIVFRNQKSRTLLIKKSGNKQSISTQSIVIPHSPKIITDIGTW